MIFLKVILGLLLFILIFLILVLLIILSAPLKGQIWLTEKSVKLRGKYLFGMMKVDYVPGNVQFYFAGFHLNKKNDSKNTFKYKKEKISKSKEKKKNKKEKNKKGIPSKEVIYLSLLLIKKLIRKIVPQKIHMSVKLGLDDPYDTGMVCMVQKILVYPLNKIDGYELSFDPLYDDLDLKVEGYAKISFTLFSLLLPIGFWAIKKPIRNYMGWTFKKSR